MHERRPRGIVFRVLAWCVLAVPLAVHGQALPQVKVERLLDSNCSSRRRSIQALVRTFKDRRSSACPTGHPAGWERLPLLCRPQRALHSPRVCGRPARALADSPRRQPATRRLVPADGATNRPGRRTRQAASGASACHAVARRLHRGDDAAYRVARRACRRDQPARRDLRPRPERAQSAGAACGHVSRRHPLRGEARGARTNLLPDLRPWRLHLRDGHARPVLSLEEPPGRLRNRPSPVQSQHASCGLPEARQHAVRVLDAGRHRSGSDSGQHDRFFG